MIKPSVAIKEIIVHKLFGTYDYVLSPDKDSLIPERLLILYGDNGSGKTTILKTLFHLLAPEDGEGHKTVVAKTPFNKFEIELTSGEKIWAKRQDGKLLGSYTMGLCFKKGTKPKTVEFIANEDNVVKSTGSKYDELQSAFLKELNKLDIGLYFLSDDRIVRLAGREKKMPHIRFDPSEEEFMIIQDFPVERSRARRIEDPERRSQQLLLDSVKRAELWIQSQAVRGASEGESNVNTLYSEILKRIAGLPLEKNLKNPDESIKSLESKVDRLEIRSKSYSQYGLLPEFNGKDIISIIKNAPSTHLGIIINVVSPYIDSVEKKLDAMEFLQRQIDAQVNTVNSFFTRKKLAFEIHEGFEIWTDDGNKLFPHMLSSGEKHLLLLFCNTLIALNRPSIFVIDEPEISLNIKWQRRLMSSLLQCADNSPIQYIIATHSFEILAQYDSNTIKLSDTSEV